MIHEAFGLDDITVRHADRMAAAGYLTLAVDLYSHGGARRCLVATPCVRLAAGEGRAFTDLATARDWLRESGRTTGKIGVIGFCMGGGFALLLAKTASTPPPSTTAGSPKTPMRPSPAPARSWPTSAPDRTLRGGAAARVRPQPPGRGPRRQGIPARRARLPQRRGDRTEGAAAAVPGRGLGPDPESAPEAWQRIEDHFAEHLSPAESHTGRLGSSNGPCCDSLGRAGACVKPYGSWPRRLRTKVSPAPTPISRASRCSPNWRAFRAPASRTF